MWPLRFDGTLDQGINHAALDCDCHSDRDHEDPRAISCWPGLLVHGQRRAYGLRNALLAALPDFGGWRRLVTGCSARGRWRGLIILVPWSRDTWKGRPFLIPSRGKQTRRVPQAGVLSLGLGFSSAFMVFCWARHSPEWRLATRQSGDWRSRARANFQPGNNPPCNPRCPAKIIYCIRKNRVWRIALKLSIAISTMCLKPIFLLGAAALFLALPLAAQDMPGPITTAPKAKPAPATPPSSDPAQEPPPPQRLHSPGDNPITNDPPSQPVAEIIKRFAERETEFRIERDNYTYTQAFAIQTIDDDGRPDGEYRMVSDIIFTPDGKRFEKVKFAPPDTLRRISLSQQDLEDVRNVQPFVLTTTELPKYNVTYVGRQQVDELSTYVFDVAPKTIEKNQRYFQGRVWVDDKDLQIVMTDGKAVPDIITKNNENVFPRFRTYRQNIEKGYWFPVFTRADDYLHFRIIGDVHIRMTVKYSNYKRYGSTVKMGEAKEIKEEQNAPK